MIDERIVEFLLGDDTLDSNIVSFASLSKPETSFDELMLPNELRQQLAKICDSSFNSEFLLLMQNSALDSEVCQAFCSRAEIALLTGHLKWIKPETLEISIRRFFREARLHSAAVCLDGLDDIPEDAKPPILKQIEQFEGRLFVHSESNLSLKKEAIQLAIPASTFMSRKKMWQSLIGNSKDATELATKFRFGKSKAIAAINCAKI